MTISGEGSASDQKGQQTVAAQAPAGSATAQNTAGQPKNWAILLIAGATQFVLALDGTIMSVTLSGLQTDLGLSDHDRSSVVTYYAFFHGLLLLLGGRAVDSWGHRRALLVGMAGFGMASLFGGLAQDSTQLLIGRATQGGFAALLAPAVFASISIIFTGAKERASAFLLIGILAIGGAATGFVLGGMLATYASWRWCLLFNVPLAVLVFALVLFVVPPARKQQGRRGFDLPGSLLSTGALASLGLAVYLQREHASALLFWIFCLLFAALTIAFVIVEQHVRAPLVPPAVLLDRTRSLAAFSNAIFVSNTLGGTLFLSTYLQKIRQYDAAATGLSVMPVLLGIILGGIAVTRLAGRFNLRALIIIGALVSSAGMWALAQLDLDASYWTGVLPSIATLGFGLGMLSVCLPDLALVGAKPEEAGAASAVFTAYGQVGGAVGTTVLTLVYTHAKMHAHGSAELAGHAATFTAASITLVLIAPIALFTASTSGARRGAIAVLQRYWRILRVVWRRSRR